MGPAFLLDTNVVTGFFNQTLPAADQRFVASLSPAISVITQVELFSSPNALPAEMAQLEEFCQVATIYRTLDATVVQATIAARLQRKMKTPDAIIAGTALAHNLTLLTRKVSDFKQLAGLAIVNPFEL